MGGETDLSDYLNQLNQKNLKKRREAIRSVIDILNEGDALAIDPLIDALSDDDLYIQIKAAKGLGIIKDVRGIEPLINALKDLSVEVRIEAAKALECMKYYTSIEPICNSFNNKNNKDIKRRCHTSSQISEKNDTDITIVRNSESLVHELYLRSQNTNYIPCKEEVVGSNSHQKQATTAEAQYSNQARSSRKSCQIFIDEKINARIDMGEFHYLGIYYPKNILEKHNRFSSRILIVKSYQMKQTKKTALCINYFVKKIRDTVKNSMEFVICVIPSHRKGYQPSGIRKIAELLCIAPAIDGTMVIERNKDLLEKHLGGPRTIKAETESITVAYQERIEGKPVLLLDDITTTGTSFRVAREMLLDKGADYIAPLALGKTYSVY